MGRCPETRIESWQCHGRTLHKSLPSQAPGPRHGPGVCPGAWHSDQAGGLLALRGLIIRARAASPRSCASGQIEVHTDAVQGQHPSGGPGTVSPPRPASSWVSEVCAVGPFYRLTESRQGPGLAQDHKLAGGTSHAGGTPFPPAWFSKVAKQILGAWGLTLGGGAGAEHMSMPMK